MKSSFDPSLLALWGPTLQQDLETARLKAWLKQSAERQRVEEEERKRLEALPPRYVVHTIHGTFARKAAWIHADSALCQQLRRSLGWRAAVEPFVWPRHGFSVQARWRAAQDFRDHLDRQIQAYRTARDTYRDQHPEYDEPEAEHVVIAHSHGGNIAFMALDTPERAAQVLGVVTLGTPFLEAQVREKKSEELIDLGTGLFSGLFAGWAVLFYGYAQGLAWSLWPWALGAVLLMVLLLSGGAWILQLMQKHAERIRRRMPRTALAPEQVAIIRVQGDEALALIAGARLAGTLADLLWAITGARAFGLVEKMLNTIDYAKIRTLNQEMRDRILMRESRRVAPSLDPFQPPKRDWREGLGAATTQALAAGLMFLIEHGTPEQQMWAMVAAGVYILPAALAVLAVLLGVPFAFLTSASLLPCGPTVPFVGPYLRVTAEPSPLGTWSVTQYDASGQDTGLFHSRAYDDYRVPPFIGRWVEARMQKEGSRAPGEPPEARMEGAA